MIERAIALPFSFNSAGELSYTNDEKKIIQDQVVLTVMTKFGERVMRPNFGSDVQKALFENIEESTETIKSSVATCFATWLPNLELIDVNPTIDTDNGVIDIQVEYRKGLVTLSQSLQLTSGLYSRSGDLIRKA